MAVSAGFTVRSLGGDLVFPAGGVRTRYLIDAFVKSQTIDATTGEIVTVYQDANGDEQTSTVTLGERGWSPTLAAVADGARRVLHVVDWQGGGGTKPAIGQYVGSAGLVDDIADGVDVRGQDGRNGTDGAGAVAGAVSHFLSLGPTYDAAAHRITAGGISNLPTLAIIYTVMPADLDRDGDDLTFSADGVEEGLEDIRGTALSAAMLTPGDLHSVLRLSGAWRIIEQLSPRPQDFVIAQVLSENDTLTAADIAGTSDATNSESTTASPRIDGSPTPSGIADPVTAGDFLELYQFLGVPDDAPDIVNTAQVTDTQPGGFSGLPPGERIAGTMNRSGVAYKWWRQLTYLYTDYANPPMWADADAGNLRIWVGLAGLPLPVPA